MNMTVQETATWRNPAKGQLGSFKTLSWNWVLALWEEPVRWVSLFLLISHLLQLDLRAEFQ
jgi:hypothetical protein